MGVNTGTTDTIAPFPGFCALGGEPRNECKLHYSTMAAPIHSGKHYYEATVTDEGLCRVGWSTQNATHELGV